MNTTKEMYIRQMGIDEKVYDYSQTLLENLKERFAKIDETAEYNQMKVVAAMQKNHVAEMHLNGTTGYGYNDDGRDTLEQVYADVFHTEAALVRPQIMCGTHALNIALSANLRPGDEQLSPVGKPYDTMDEIIGIRPSKGSLAEYGVTYSRLSSPGLGKEVGATLGVNQSFYQGLFLAPTVVAGALKGAIFAANAYEKLGYKVIPDSTESRHDIIQAVELNTPEALIAFCQGIQAAAPVDSFVSPEPWAMPGYDSDVIMAAGAFVQGSSIELSADGPLRPPYTAFFQGGLTWYHAKYGIMMSMQKLYEAGILSF